MKNILIYLPVENIAKEGFNFLLFKLTSGDQNIPLYTRGYNVINGVDFIKSTKLKLFLFYRNHGPNQRVT